MQKAQGGTNKENQIKMVEKKSENKKDQGSIQKQVEKPKRARRRKKKTKSTPIWCFKTRKTPKAKAKKSPNEDAQAGTIKPLKRIIRKSQKGVRQLKYLENNKLISDNGQKVRKRGTHNLKHRSYDSLDFRKYYDQPKQVVKIQQQEQEQNQSPAIIERHQVQIVRQPEKQEKKQKKSQKYKQKLQKKNQRIAELQRKNRELETKLIKSLEERVKDMQKTIREQSQQLKYQLNMNILGTNDSLIKIQ